MSTGTDGETATQVAEAPAEVETSTPVEIPENETEETEKAEGEEPEVKEEDPVEKPKRESGYDRMKRKNQYLQSEILRLTSARTESHAETDKAPREEDFGGDWGKYIAATAAYEAAKAVKGSLAEDRKVAQQNRVVELRSEIMADFEERAETFKAKATDFDTVVSKFVDNGGKFSDAVRELVTESDVGPQLTYHLAKNPSIANRINALPPLQAAKEIGRLEDELSRPPKQVTKAPPPVKALNGGSAPASQDADLAAYIKKTYGR